MSACDLTPRERQVLTLLSRGQSKQQVASGLGIGYQTVVSHAKMIRRKLLARNTAHAVAIGLVSGQIRT